MTELPRALATAKKLVELKDSASKKGAPYNLITELEFQSRQLGPELAQSVVDLYGQLEVSDKLIESRNEILRELECEVHGECVPGALDKLRDLKEAVGTMRTMVDDLRHERSRLVRIIQNIDAADPRPDLSCHKHVAAFDFIKRQVNEALRREEEVPMKTVSHEIKAGAEPVKKVLHEVTEEHVIPHFEFSSTGEARFVMSKNDEEVADVTVNGKVAQAAGPLDVLPGDVLSISVTATDKDVEVTAGVQFSVPLP